MTVLCVWSLAMGQKMEFMEQMMTWLKSRPSLSSFVVMNVPPWKANQRYSWSKLAVALNKTGYPLKATVTRFHSQAHLCQQMQIFSFVLLQLLVIKATDSPCLARGLYPLFLKYSKNMLKESTSWIWCWESTTVLLDFSARKASSKCHARSACWQGKCSLIQSIAEHENSDKEISFTVSHKTLY